MTDLDQVPAVEREVLRLLFFAPNHTATAGYVAERCYYPDEEVGAAFARLVDTGAILPGGLGEDLVYSPSAALLTQMKLKNHRADAALREGLARVKRLVDEEERDTDSE